MMDNGHRLGKKRVSSAGRDCANLECRCTRAKTRAFGHKKIVNGHAFFEGGGRGGEPPAPPIKKNKFDWEACHDGAIPRVAGTSAGKKGRTNNLNSLRGKQGGGERASR